MLDIVAHSPNWTRGVVRAWKEGCDDAMHGLESRTSLRTLVAALSDPVAWGQVILSLGDNLAEVLSTEIGRARLKPLNTVCRRAAGWQFATGSTWRRRYIESGRNFSDADSRLADAGVIAAGLRFH